MRALFLALTLSACDSPEMPTPTVADPPTEQAEKTTPASTDNAVIPAPDDGWENTTDTEIKGPKARARHILIAYNGATQAPGGTRRSKADAQELASKVREQILAGDDFSALAKTHSDGGTAHRGGELGTFPKGVMHENFEAAVFALQVGALSDVVETPFGFHVIERQEVIEIRVAQVLVQWKGRHLAKTNRTKEEAKARAETALVLIQSGTPFRDVAKTHSDGGTGKRGTDLGWFQKGQMVPAFDTAAFALKPGQTSGVIESPLGFHLIHRLK